MNKHLHSSLVTQVVVAIYSTKPTSISFHSECASKKSRIILLKLLSKTTYVRTNDRKISLSSALLFERKSAINTLSSEVSAQITGAIF
jgi:hypothetical protein